MKTVKFIAIGLSVVAAYAVYKKHFSKDGLAKKIINNGYFSGAIETLKGFEMGFLKAWASASQKAESVFTYQGKVFNTKGGKAK